MRPENAYRGDEYGRNETRKNFFMCGRVDADMITETLNDRGIPAYSESKGSGDYMNIYMGTSMFGNDIYVNEKDEDRAKEIVAVLTMPSDANSDAADIEIPARSLDRRIRVVRIISLLAAVLMVIGAVVPSVVNIFFG